MKKKNIIKRPTIKELLAELRQIQTQESVEMELPERQDRPNPLLKGTPGIHLLKFAGTLRAEDAEEMMRAIECDCRRVDVNG